jgi:hypothetical protein
MRIKVLSENGRVIGAEIHNVGRCGNCTRRRQAAKETHRGSDAVIELSQPVLRGEPRQYLPGSRVVTNVLYFLYFHTVESLLKPT